MYALQKQYDYLFKMKKYLAITIMLVFSISVFGQVYSFKDIKS